MSDSYEKEMLEYISKAKENDQNPHYIKGLEFSLYQYELEIRQMDAGMAFLAANGLMGDIDTESAIERIKAKIKEYQKNADESEVEVVKMKNYAIAAAFEESLRIIEGR